jgi:C-terminal processing protease CtpA/Prc
MITIAGIRKDSPASRADLQVDDLIMQLQGKNINRYVLKEVRELLSSQKGKQIEMEINRNGVSKKVKFKLEDRMY